MTLLAHNPRLAADHRLFEMAAQREQKFTPLETEADDFEDVALLLDLDQQQTHKARGTSWKQRLFALVARDGARSHTGFQKLDQSDNAEQTSGRRQGSTQTPSCKSLHIAHCICRKSYLATEA